MRLSTFNARVETVTTKPFFREAFKQTRCIVLASGYYEWQDTPGGKQPHYFTRTDGQVISFAGLWDEWKNRATGETLKSCTMIITEPNAMVAEVHDRMPVVLGLGILRRGLSPQAERPRAVEIGVTVAAFMPANPSAQGAHLHGQPHKIAQSTRSSRRRVAPR